MDRDDVVARRADSFIWAVGISALGSGMIYPVTAVYLSKLPGVGPGGTAAYFAVLAVANISVAGVLSVRRAQTNLAHLSALGAVLATAGFLGMTIADGLIGVLAAGVIVGLGQGGIASTITAVMASMAPQSQHREFYGRRYRAMNIGIGIGAVAGGALADRLPDGWLPVLFAANALSYLPLAWLMLRHSASWRRTPAAEGPAERVERVKRRLPGPVVALALVNLCAIVFAISQLEVSAPLISVQLLQISWTFVGVMVAANTAAVVFLLKPVTRLLRPFDELVGLTWAAGLWVLSYAVMVVASQAGILVASIGLIVFAVLFGAGEAAFSCSYQPLLVRRAGPDGIGPAGAFSSLFATTGNIVGPAAGVAIVALGEAWLAWSLLALPCLVLTAVLAYAATRTGVLDRARATRSVA